MHMHMQLTSLYAVMQRMQAYIDRANPIRKDVAADWPNWLPEGVVGCHLFRKVVHPPVASEGVAHYRCRRRLL